jgi:hypothetical protein
MITRSSTPFSSVALSPSTPSAVHSVLASLISHLFSKRKPNPLSTPRVSGPGHRISTGCISNARRSFIGDMMIARATRDLPADTELTWWYQPPPTEPVSYLSHQKVLLRTWGFMCKCPLCRDLRVTPESVIKKRKQLRADFRVLIPTQKQGHKA